MAWVLGHNPVEYKGEHVCFPSSKTEAHSALNSRVSLAACSTIAELTPDFVGVACVGAKLGWASAALA